MTREMDERVFGDFQRMRNEMDRLFESLMPGHKLPPASQRCLWCPPTDVYETATEAIVKVEIAGVDEDDFQISFSDGVLTVAGKRREQGGGRRAYHQMEIWSGPFRSQVDVPWQVDADAIEAKYSAGFLIVRLPKARPETKEVPIRGSEE